MLMCLALVSVATVVMACAAKAGDPAVHFPGQDWDAKSPADAGVDGDKLQAVISMLCEPSQNRSLGPTQEAADFTGVAIKDGCLIATWGKPDYKFDWFSSSKPVLATLLLLAVQEGRLASVDDRLADHGWDLSPKDQSMTYAHLANMTSGYSLPDKPGAAYAYNDYGIRLYAVALDRIFSGEGLNPPAARLLGQLQLQDGDVFSNTNLHVKTSARDFARIGWLWMNRGHWNGQQVLERRFFDQYCRPHVPPELPVSAGKEIDDYLKIGTYGGNNNQHTYGPGLYGFNWWFNQPVPGLGRRNWPAAPPDTFASLGFGGNNMYMFRGSGLLVAARGNWGKSNTDVPTSRTSQIHTVLLEAVKA